MSEYNRLNHCKFLIQYHIIWCPKYRFNVLNEKIELELRGILRIISERYGYEIKEMEIMPDHIHLFI
ncbi:IS200/IS605 family transposase, partial [Aquibacillus koreensis]